MMTAVAPPVFSAPPPIVDLDDVELLLDYVARSGKTVDPAVIAIVVPAVRRGNAAWDDANAGALFAAITQLCKVAWPVTAESIKASRKDGPRQITIFRVIAIVLTAIIIPLSYCSFTTSQLSTSIGSDMKALSTSVVLQGGAAPTTAPTLAASTRWVDVEEFNLATHSIHEESEKLNGFLFFGKIPSDPAENPTAPLTNYRQVLTFTKLVQNDIAIYYGVINAVVLPILYALLGACAFLLRLFTDELNKRTFSNRYVIAARFVVAMIAGLIIGLFNIAPLTQGASLSPQALAFLAGYSSDVIFSFLEGIIQTVKKPNTAQAPS